MAYDANKPAGPNALTADVRANFADHQSRITALESGGGGGGPAVALIGPSDPAGTSHARGTLFVNENTGAVKYWDGAWTPITP